MDVLLDIAEPGQSARPHEGGERERRRVVGIDLGTTYSLVAAVTLEGKSSCIPDDRGAFSLPSVVHYAAEGDILVGEEARARAVAEPEATIVSVKRFMGRGLADLAKAPFRGSYLLEEGEGGMLRFRVRERRLSPVEVSAEILKTLRRRAEEALGGSLFGAVVTVPAYFDDAQRLATKDSCRLAGLEVLRLVNEPTAAALAYGLDHGQDGCYAIYDLGGGTFDISILKLDRGVFQVLSTGGNSALGGDDFDQRLAAWMLEQARIGQVDPSLWQEMRALARRAKEALTGADSVTVDVPAPSGRIPLTVSREVFEGLIGDLVRSTGVACRRALRDANLEPERLQGVVLVGGATRIPLVRRHVAEFFGREPFADLDPDQIVALGASLQANLLAGNDRTDMLLVDVIPLSLGVETMGGLVERIIPRNSPIPTARAQEFTTFKDGQTAMAIHVVQGERETVDQCRSLARFELRGIPPLVAGAARIRVTYQVDADGLLTVTAREQSTGVEQTVAVKPSYGLSPGEIENMLKEAMLHGAEDLEERALREARVEAKRVLLAVENALQQDGDLLSAAERAAIHDAIDALRRAIEERGHRELEAAIKELDRATIGFAQRRMDTHIRATMTGHKPEEFL
ncbi:MAG: Fe-S protein assembly chaperone HscA [Magnetococcales bacterium]|nr:Fe-S protein assembly chaperone HscA [Magnetococcales bacterium]